MKPKDWSGHLAIEGGVRGSDIHPWFHMPAAMAFEVGDNEGLAWCEPGFGVDGSVGVHVLMLPMPDGDAINGWPLPGGPYPDLRVMPADSDDEDQIAAFFREYPDHEDAEAAARALRAWHDEIGDKELTRIS